MVSSQKMCRIREVGETVGLHNQYQAGFSGQILRDFHD